jgi:hypothetical protein
MSPSRETVDERSGRLFSESSTGRAPCSRLFSVAQFNRASAVLGCRWRPFAHQLMHELVVPSLELRLQRTPIRTRALI